MDFDAIIRDIKNRKFHPVYALHGEEGYFIDKIADLIEETALSESEKSFNQKILYGKETDFLTLMEIVKRYPMMAPHQVVILKEAQLLKDFERMAEYVTNPMPTTILVLCHKNKKIPQNKAFGKAIVKNSVAYYSEKIRSHKIPDWISNYLANLGLKINQKAAILLEEYLGNDLSKIVNSLDKLSINLAGSKEIGVEAIEKYIGISKDYNVFELNNAMSDKDVLKANRIINYFRSNPKAGPMPLVLGALYGFFSKTYLLHSLAGKDDRTIARELSINPYFIKEYKTAAKNYNKGQCELVFDFLHEYDLKSKGVGSNVDSGVLLQEMIYKILHV